MYYALLALGLHIIHYIVCLSVHHTSVLSRLLTKMPVDTSYMENRFHLRVNCYSPRHFEVNWSKAKVTRSQKICDDR